MVRHVLKKCSTKSSTMYCPGTKKLCACCSCCCTWATSSHLSATSGVPNLRPTGTAEKASTKSAKPSAFGTTSSETPQALVLPLPSLPAADTAFEASRETPIAFVSSSLPLFRDEGATETRHPHSLFRRCFKTSDSNERTQKTASAPPWQPPVQPGKLFPLRSSSMRTLATRTILPRYGVASSAHACAASLSPSWHLLESSRSAMLAPSTWGGKGAPARSGCDSPLWLLRIVLHSWRRKVADRSSPTAGVGCSRPFPTEDRGKTRQGKIHTGS